MFSYLDIKLLYNNLFNKPIYTPIDHNFSDNRGEGGGEKSETFLLRKDKSVKTWPRKKMEGVDFGSSASYILFMIQGIKDLKQSHQVAK